MKRLLVLLLCLFLFVGCKTSNNEAYQNASFSVVLPDNFRPVENTSVVCFAPYGDPLLSSSVTFYATELNWYFDSFTVEEYADALSSLCGYDSLSVEDIAVCRTDGHDARRIACRVQIDQGTHDLIIYAINADRCYFMILLNREGDSYIGDFDAMMNSFHLKGKQ